MSRPRWISVDGRIALEHPDGTRNYPSAVQIVGAEHKNRFDINGVHVESRPSDDVPDVSFSRFPLDARLAVSSWQSDQESVPLCWLALVGEDATIPLPSLPEPPDQVLAADDWFPLVPEQIAEIADILAELSIPALGPISLRQYLDLLNQNRVPVHIEEGRPSFAPDTAASECAPQPAAVEIKATLYPYQLTGVRWLRAVTAENLGCILGDEMGLGKTLQIIALFAHEVAAGKKPNAVIGPATLVENWRRELLRFTPHLTVAVHWGSDRTGFPSTLAENDVVLVSYDTAVRDLSLLKMIDWNVVVIDEAQAIKNPDTQRAVSLKQIPRRIGIGVTGTPVENSLRDLWSIMGFACPGFLGPLHQFESRFQDEAEDAARLEPLVSPLMLRRSVSDVASDLPEKINVPQAVPLSAKSAEAYESLRRSILEEYGPAGGLVSLTKLRMFCTHPFLVSSDRGDPALFSTKYMRLLEILDEIILARHKAILFTSFTGMTDILVKDLPGRYAIFCDFIDGRVPVADRQNTIDRFQQFAGAGVLVLNPRAAGTGLNITAARHVIHYNLEWNPAIEDQATARAHRRGQEHPVTVHRLFHPETVEEIIDDRLRRKRHLAANAVVGTRGDAEHMEDIARALEVSPLIRKEQA